MAWYDIPVSRVAALLESLGISPAGFISADADNALVEGTDNKLFVPESGGGGSTNITLLGSASVDLNDDTAKQNIYTVPAGKKAVITEVILRSFSDVPTTAASLAGMGWDVAATDVVRAIYIPDEITATTQSLRTSVSELSHSNPFLREISPDGTAGQVFGAKVDGAEGTALTCVVDVFGYTYDE